MNNIFGTHLQVLANTHPELGGALIKLIGENLNTNTLERYQGSPLYNTIIGDMASIISRYSSNYHKMNLVLTRLNKLVDMVSDINYEHLSEQQRIDLPDLAKEVDQTNQHIREDIFPATSQEKENAVEQINDILNKGKEYLVHVKQEMELHLNNINSEFGLEVKIEDGQDVLSQQDLDEWLERNRQVESHLIAKLLADRDSVEGFCKLILAIEALIHIDQKNTETKTKDMKKLVKYVLKISFDRIDFIQIDPEPGQFVAELDEYDERSQKLEEIFEGYPIGDESLDPKEIKDLERLSKPKDIFTSVDGDEQ